VEHGDEMEFKDHTVAAFFTDDKSSRMGVHGVKPTVRPNTGPCSRS
jgi:hypothetical protein